MAAYNARTGPEDPGGAVLLLVALFCILAVVIIAGGPWLLQLVHVIRQRQRGPVCIVGACVLLI